MYSFYCTKRTHNITLYNLQWDSTYLEAGYSDRLDPSVKFVKNSTKRACLDVTGYRIKYSTALWFLELQIRRDRKVYTQVHAVNCKNRTPNCQCRLFSNKNTVIRIFCISGLFAVTVNPDKWSSTVDFRLTFYRRKEIYFI